MIGTTRLANETKVNLRKTGSGLIAVVPQIFFDIIARLVAGFLAVTFLLFTVREKVELISRELDKSAALLPESILIKFLCAASIFYIIAIVFYGIWALLVKFFIWFAYSIVDFDPVFIEVCYGGEPLSLRYDYIKLHRPDAGSRITKLKAEIHMSGTCSVAALVSFFIPILTPFEFSLFHGICFFLIFVGLLSAHNHFTRRVYWSIMSVSTLLDFPTDKKCFDKLPNREDCEPKKEIRRAN